MFPVRMRVLPPALSWKVRVSTVAPTRSAVPVVARKIVPAVSTRWKLPSWVAAQRDRAKGIEVLHIRLDPGRRESDEARGNDVERVGAVAAAVKMSPLTM